MMVMFLSLENSDLNFLSSFLDKDGFFFVKSQVSLPRGHFLKSKIKMMQTAISGTRVAPVSLEIVFFRAKSSFFDLIRYVYIFESLISSGALIDLAHPDP